MAIWPAAFLLLLSYPLILHQLDAYSLVNQDEDIYHTAATQMVKSGNWFARLGTFFDERFGRGWKNKDKKFWDEFDKTFEVSKDELEKIM